MLSLSMILSGLLCYLAILLIIAWYGQQQGLLNKLASSPITYTLSLAVYCTSWTFFGSVGKAATSGIGFLPVYFGPTLAMLLAGLMMRRMISIKERYRITSIADFLATRYYRSQGIAALVTLIAVFGITPYIGLQLQAISSSVRLVIPGNFDTGGGSLFALIMIASLICFTIAFGVRKLDPTERHPGIILALAFECIVKLLAFLAVGLFVCFQLFDSPVNLVAQAQEKQIDMLANPPDFFQWTTLMLLSAAAFFFLPRQFHVAVVENSNKDHWRQASWGLPLYLLLINLFVIPIALAGLTLGYPAQQGDTFVLQLPLDSGASLITLAAFIGGVAAATGMITISSMTLSTMTVNHLLLPVMEYLPATRFLRRGLLQFRWLTVALLISGGYLFNEYIGSSYMLVNIGLISFAAVIQFLPAIIGGLFWRKATRFGALLGLTLGFSGWGYCLILPTFVQSGWLPAEILISGPFGLSWLNPEALFGLSKVDSLTHGVFWSLCLNVVGFMIGSLCTEVPEMEAHYYQQFFEAQNETEESLALKQHHLEKDIPLMEKRHIIHQMLSQYLRPQEVESVMLQAEEKFELTNLHYCSLLELSRLEQEIDQKLSGAIGAASAASALKRAEILNPAERRSLTRSYSEMLSELSITPDELKQKIDYYRERQQLILQHTSEQAATIRNLEEEAERRRLAEDAREETARQLQSIMDFAPSAIYLKDPEGRYLNINNEFLRIHNTTEEKVLGHRADEFMPAAVAAPIMAHDTRVMERLEALEFEELTDPDSKRTFISVKFPILNNEGKPVALCGISTDISERIRLEQELKNFSHDLELKVEERTSELKSSNASLACTLEDLRQTQQQLVEAEKMASLASLVAGLAHEINTPLGICVTAVSTSMAEVAGIQGKAEDGSLTQSGFSQFCEEAQQHLNLVNDNLSRAVALVQSFKELSAHEGDEHLQEIELCSWLQQLRVSHQQMIQSQGHSLTIECPDNLTLTTFPQSLNKAFEYMIENAIEHAFADQSGEITISATPEGDNQLYISVRDNGSGISEEMAQRMFDPFITSKRNQGKVGLGAHILYNLVTHKLNGQISVRAIPEGGTELLISLDRAISSPLPLSQPLNYQI